jgi:hypothetical protein
MTYTCNYSGASVNVATTGTVLICPANSTNVSGQCVCASTHPEANGSCTVKWKASLDALNASGSILSYEGTTPTMTACHEGFAVTGSGSAVGLKNGVGRGEIYGPFTGTGGACGVVVAGAAAPSPCKPGEFSGEVNGQAVCIPPITSKTADSTVTAPASGSASAPTSGIQGAPAGAVTGTTSTQCTDGRCKTTTTYKDGDGSVVGTATKDDTFANFCAVNPGASICAPQELACEKEPDSLNCRALDVPTDSIPTREVTATFGVEDLGLGSGSCPSPVSVNTSNADFEISFIKWCDATTTYIRPVVLVIAAFAALMIALPKDSL